MHCTNYTNVGDNTRKVPVLGLKRASAVLGHAKFEKGFNGFHKMSHAMLWPAS